MNEYEVIVALEQAVKHQVCKDCSFRFEGMTREYYIPDLLYDALMILKERKPTDQKEGG